MATPLRNVPDECSLAPVPRAYRGKTLLALKDSEPNGRDILVQELGLLDALVKVHLKNYQVWSVLVHMASPGSIAELASYCCRQHRRAIVLALDDPSRELGFTTRALAFDSKNYHTWAYRQWVFSHFYEQPNSEHYQKNCADELEFTRHLLQADVRNNSAWNHRFFVVFRRTQPASEDIIQREIEYVAATMLNLQVSELTPASIVSRKENWSKYQIMQALGII